ncbi:NOTCH2 protein [Salpingoeca rosetta]|uniref:NOTCH2 protein n=1 Tax=Salpingoeca rosetta (strain ATCC 50818 / BSB-021) TaxID=946362 RepID=F2U4J1_SALR5|nr:NOTCH2 protein [Salpingoeca rosetta]EGD82557.1 NOTCH2 protein [Salpingoeca rosetta]|eukprot:XP_004995793.1 NOTCH2 protein [Salpingoeca rosetta]
MPAVVVVRSRRSGVSNSSLRCAWLALSVLCLVLVCGVPGCSAANSRPYLVQISPNKVPENIPEGDVIAQLSTIDFDFDQTHTYQLKSTHGGRIALSGDKLVATSIPLNYEVAEITYLEIVSTDNGSPPLSQTFQVPLRITDRNDPPHRLTLSNPIITKDLNASDTIGSFTVADQDNNRNRNWLTGRPTQTHVIELCPSSSFLGSFLSIDSSLNLVLSGAVVGVPEQFDACFRVTDSGSPPESADFTKTLIWEGSAKPPLLITFTATSIEETTPVSTQAVGGVVGQAIAYHPDSTAVIEFATLPADTLAVSNDTAPTCAVLTASELPAGVTVPDYISEVARCSVDVVLVRPLNYEEDDANITVTISAQDVNAQLPAFATFSLALTDANDPPDGVLLASTVREDVQRFQLISPLVVDDEDASQTHTITLLTATLQDGAPCPAVIVAGDTSLLANDTACFDFERNPIIALSVLVTDSGTPPLSAVFNLTLQVLDVNEQPALVRLNNTHMPELSPANAVVAEIAVGDPDNYNSAVQGVACRLLDANSPFAIVAPANPLAPPSSSADEGSTNSGAGEFVGQLVSGGVVVVDRPFLIDYESAASHELPVRCTDTGSPALSRTITFTINITNVNEPPTALSLSGTRVAENMPAGTAAGFLFAVDPDDTTSGGSGSLEFCVVEVTGAATQQQQQPPSTAPATVTTVSGDSGRGGGGCTARDESAFRVVGNRLETTRPFNAEEAPLLHVRVRAADQGGLWTEREFDVTVADQNDPPLAIMLTPTPVRENEAGAVLGSLATVDEDASQTHTYTAIVEEATTPIDVIITNGSTLQLAAAQALDYERTPLLRVRVTSTDSGTPQARSISAVFDIPVENVNEAPTSVQLQPLLSLGHATTRLVVPEDTPVGTPIARISVVDPDNTPYATEQQTHTCRVTAIATDPDNTNTNNNNSSSSSSSTTAVPSSSPATGDPSTSVVVVVTVVMVGNTTELHLAQPLDFENTPDMLLRVACTDSGTPPLTASSDVTLAISNVNEPPSIAFLPAATLNATTMSPGSTSVGSGMSQSGGMVVVRVRENTVAPLLIGHARVSDPDDCASLRCGPPSTFTFTASPFDIVQVLSDKRVVLKRPLDFEAAQRRLLMLTVTDSVDDPTKDSPITARVNVSVVVEDANDPITAVSCALTPVPEDASPGTQLGTCTVSDQDAPTTAYGRHRLSVEWTNAPSPLLAQHGIYADQDSSTLRLNASLDYETTATLQLRVRAQDVSASPLSFETGISVPVVNVDEPPQVQLSIRKMPLEEGTYTQAELARITAAVDSEGAQVSCTAAPAPGPVHTTTTYAGGNAGGGVDEWARPVYCRDSRREGYNVSITTANAVVLSGTVDFECTKHANVSLTCSDGTTEAVTFIVVPIADVAEPPQAAVFTPSQALLPSLAAISPAPVFTATTSVANSGNATTTPHAVAGVGDPMHVAFIEQQAAAAGEGAGVTLGVVGCVAGTSNGCTLTLARATVAAPLAASPSLSSSSPLVVPSTRPAVDVAVSGEAAVVSLDAATGTIAITDQRLNYEAGAVWTLTLTANDNGVGGDGVSVVSSAEFTAVIVVRDAPEAPTAVSTLCGCRDTPCQNGGRCVEPSEDLTGLTFTCMCPPGFAGVQCEAAIADNAGDGTAQANDGGSLYCLRVGAGVQTGTTLARLVVADEDIGDTFSVEVGGPLSSGLSVTAQLDVVVTAPLDALIATALPQQQHTLPASLPVWLLATDAAGLRANISATIAVTPCAGVLGACGPDDTCRVDVASGDATCECGPGFVFSQAESRCVERVCLHAREGEVCTALTDTCASGQCENGAICVDGVDSMGRNTFQCLCPAGFGGFRCDELQTSCSQQPCLNGGTCNDNTADSGYTCVCTASYTGARCQYPANACDNNRCSGLTVCVPRPAVTDTEGTASQSAQPYTCASQQSLVELQLSAASACNSGDDGDGSAADASATCGQDQTSAVELTLGDATPDGVTVYVVGSARVDDLHIITLAVIDPVTGATLDASVVTHLLLSYCSNATTTTGDGTGTGAANATSMTTTTTAVPSTTAAAPAQTQAPTSAAQASASAGATNPLCDPGSVVIIDSGTGSLTPSTTGQLPLSTSTVPVVSTTTASPTTANPNAGASAASVSPGVIVGYIFGALLLIVFALLTISILRRRAKNESVVINFDDGKKHRHQQEQGRTLEAANPAFLRTPNPWLEHEEHVTDTRSDHHDLTDGNDRAEKTSARRSVYAASRSSEQPRDDAAGVGEQHEQREDDPRSSVFEALLSHPGLVYSDANGTAGGEDGEADPLHGVRRRRSSAAAHAPKRRSRFIGDSDDDNSDASSDDDDTDAGDGGSPVLREEDEDVGYIEVESVGPDGTKSVRRVRRPADDGSGGLNDPVILNPLFASAGLLNDSDDKHDDAGAG